MIPNHLPTLSTGPHSPGEGRACVMEYVALLAGEEWTDTPACTHPVLARMAQNVNDRLADSHRHLLVPLIGRLFGTTPPTDDHEAHLLSVRLAVWCARQVLPTIDDEHARKPSEEAILAAEGWCEARVTAAECRAAAEVAQAAATDAAKAVYAANGDTAFYATAAATNAAKAVYAAAANAHDLVGLLTGLLDEYDRLTGRVEHRIVTDADLSNLAAAVG